MILRKKIIISLISSIFFVEGCRASSGPRQDTLDEAYDLIKQFTILNDPSSFSNPVSFASKRAALAQQIAEKICPEKSRDAFESTTRLDGFDPAKISPSKKQLEALNAFLEVLNKEEQSLVQHIVGRLLIVGFYDNRGPSYLILCGSEGIRTLFCALRDVGKPYAIEQYLYHYDTGESDTCNFFLESSLKDLIKEKRCPENLKFFLQETLRKNKKK